MKTLVAGLAALALAVMAAGAAAPATPSFTIYDGADFSLVRGGRAYRVLNIVGSNFVVRYHGKFEHWHIGTVPVSIAIKRATKMGRWPARLEDFVCERAYAPGTDPEEKAAIAYTNLLSDQYAAADEAINQMVVNGGPLPSQVSPSVRGPQTMAANPAYAQGIAAQIENDLEGNAPVFQNADDTRNSIHISFRIVSPVRLEAPYALFVAVIHAPGHEHEKQQWIGATEVDPVLPNRPTAVDFFQGGFPPGYRIDSFAVDLYDDGGREIPTDRSPDLQELTREQAFARVVADYLRQYPKATLPASPAMTELPEDWKRHVDDPRFQTVCFVKVDATGHPEGVYGDADCHVPLNDAYVSNLLMDVRFHPALEHGRPVPTVTQIVPQALLP